VKLHDLDAWSATAEMKFDGDRRTHSSRIDASIVKLSNRYRLDNRARVAW
jgi:hypothetical protein